MNIIDTSQFSELIVRVKPGIYVTCPITDLNKFKNITVIHLDSSDYVDGEVTSTVAQEIDTADIVIEGERVVKNRLHNTKLPQD
ncbi:TPA: hypothetical protein ACIVHZ_001900 [Salmonella enterica subsp. enterica serovar Thompson]|nr:hypothetical protein [Salmonella enterica subsp. enterica serovar Thompson]ECY7950000.1 hypothetical protein [Salmonella enterica subsp. enterica serovar Thompson]